METIKLTRARAHAGLAAMLLGSVAWSGGALAQNVSTTNPNAVTTSTTTTNAATTNAATTDAATTNAVTVNAAARGQNNNSGSASSGSGATDPGVRGGDPGVGGALPGLNDVERQYFDVAKEVFQEVDAGPDGLGPRFNLDSCSGCHSQPTIGGTSPATNPQVAVATLMGAKNVVPSFITANGPIREARFVRNRDGSPDGGVHSLFVITGRSDAPGCNIAQPNFAAELARNNVVFRIPTPVFGLGLVENVSDGTLEASLAANAQQKRALGISGRFNRNRKYGKPVSELPERHRSVRGIHALFCAANPGVIGGDTGRSGIGCAERNSGSDDGNRDRGIDYVEPGIDCVERGIDDGGVGHGGRFERDDRRCGVVNGAAVVIRFVRCFGHPREPGVFQCRLPSVSHQDLHDREIAADG